MWYVERRPKPFQIDAFADFLRSQVGFFAFLITMWALSDHVPAKRVFTEFQDGGGWGSIGLSTLVGIGSPLWFFIGPDAGAHMSEELEGV